MWLMGSWLQAMFRNLEGKKPASLAALKAEVLELRKYAVLNSTAAIKAVKKRNRHLRAAVGGGFRSTRATDLLSQQHFFTSPKLASLSTQAEILTQVTCTRPTTLLTSLDNASFKGVVYLRLGTLASEAGPIHALLCLGATLSQQGVVSSGMTVLPCAGTPCFRRCGQDLGRL